MMSATEVMEPTSLDDLLDTLRLNRTKLWGDEVPSRWVFRGQADSKWLLLQSIWRPEVLSKYNNVLGRIDAQIAAALPNFRGRADCNNLKIMSDSQIRTYVANRVLEEILLDEFEDLINSGGFTEILILHRTGWKEMIRGGFMEPLDAYKYKSSSVAVAQHSGLPTHFLDWTLDPMKALVFALTKDENEQELAIWAIDTQFLSRTGELTNIRERVKKDLPVLHFLQGRRLENPFLNAQDGCFTYLEFFRQSFVSYEGFPDLGFILEQEADRVKHTEPVLKKIIFKFDAGSKLDLKRRLYRERKTLFHMMPSFACCADVVKASVREQIRPIL